LIIDGSGRRGAGAGRKVERIPAKEPAMKTLALLILALATALPAAAGHRHPDYAAYARAPISEFRFTQLYNWQRTGDKSMVLWTKPSTAYLLTLVNKCHALDSRVAVQVGGVDGVQGRLQAGSGDVIIGDLRCRVQQIQPIDLAAMKAAKSA
jgi:hypothetical protein